MSTQRKFILKKSLMTRSSLPLLVSINKSVSLQSELPKEGISHCVTFLSHSQGADASFLVSSSQEIHDEFKTLLDHRHPNSMIFDKYGKLFVGDSLGLIHVFDTTVFCSIS